MIFKWESEKEKLKRFIKISPKKKLEWLHEMHEFMLKSLSKKQRNLFFKIRMSR